MNKLELYLEVLHFNHEVNIVTEGILDIFPKLDFKKYYRQMLQRLDKRDPLKSLQRIEKIVPSGITKNILTKVENELYKKVDKYKKLKTTGQNVLKNSIPEIGDSMLEFSSSFLAISAFAVKKSDDNLTPEKSLVKNLKEFVYKVQTYTDDYDETTSKTKLAKATYTDMIVGFVVISTALAIITGLFFGGYLIGSLIGGGISIINVKTIFIFFLVILCIYFVKEISTWPIKRQIYV